MRFFLKFLLINSNLCYYKNVIEVGGFMMNNDIFNDDMNLIPWELTYFDEYKVGYALGKFEVLDYLYNGIMSNTLEKLVCGYWYSSGYKDAFEYYYNQYTKIGYHAIEEIVGIDSADILWQLFFGRVMEYNCNIGPEDIHAVGFALVLKK